MQIHVTQEDIDQGKRGWCAECPLALGITRAAGVPAHVSTQVLLISPLHFGVVARCKTPPEAMDFLVAFDSGDPVQPFSFSLPADLPSGDVGAPEEQER